MNVRARLENPDEFFYPDSNEPKDLATFWTIIEGYRVRKRNYEINWGTGVRDDRGTEIYQSDIVDVFFNSKQGDTLNRVEEGYVDYVDGCFVVLNSAGLIWDVGASSYEEEDYTIQIKGNIYDHIMP